MTLINSFVDANLYCYVQNINLHALSTPTPSLVKFCLLRFVAEQRGVRYY
jgi:hypothetical protein